MPTTGAGMLLAGVATVVVGCSQPVAPATHHPARASATPATGTLAVTVKHVIDGDTILVTGLPEGRGLIRLIGINAPETGSGKTIRECFGVEARAWLTRRTPPGTPLRLVADVGERDRFGRRLAYVYAADGTFLNAELVASGYAQTMTIPPNVRHAEELRGLERRARAENRGLWGSCRQRGTPLASSKAFTRTAGNRREDP